MKLLLIGDLHLRGHRLPDISGAWKRAVSWANNNSVDMICQMGDIFDHANVYGRSASTGSVYEALISPFFEQKEPVPLLAIAGNHDLAAPKDKDALSPIDRYPWITVVRKPSVVSVNDKLSICAVPWVNKAHLVSKLIAQGAKPKDASARVHDAITGMMGPLAKEVAEAKAKGRFVLFMGHLEVTGAKREGGSVQSGGSFEFAPLELASIGADAYALAHIHVRQSIPGLPNHNDGYVGALCQLSFGEEDQQVGCRLIEVDGRRIVTDRWLDNKTSPRYINALTMEGLQYRVGVDNVKLKGAIRPETMPPGVIFEKLPTAATVARRSEKALESFMPLRLLLEEWKRKDASDIPIELLEEQAEAIRRQFPVPTDSIGSLERIERIRIENLTSHVFTDVLTDFEGICGICGPNGSGKSTFIETVSLAPYGSSPSHPDLFSLVPNADAVDSASEITLVSSGRRYRIRREFAKRKKSFTHSAYVFDADIEDKAKTPEEREKAALAGPKVGDVYKLCSDLIGAEDLVMAGIFSSQGDAGNATKFKASARKDLFGKLLGTDQFLTYSEAAKELGKADSAIVVSRLARIESIKNELAKEKAEQAMLDQAAEDIREKEKTKTDISRELVSAEARTATLAESRKEYDRALGEKASLLAQLDRISSEGRALKAKKDEPVNTEAIEEELKAARAAKDSIQEISERLAEISEARAKAASMASATSTLALGALSNIDRKYAKYAADKEREAEAVGLEHATAITRVRQKLQGVKSNLDFLLRKKEEIERRIGLLSAPGFPDLAECRVCPLAKDIVGMRDSLPAIVEEIAAASASAERGDVKLASMEKAAGDAVAAVRAGIVPNEDFEPEARKLANEGVAEAARIAASVPMPRALVEKKVSLEVVASTVVSLETKLASVKKRKDEAVHIDARIEALRASYKELDTRIKAFQVPPCPSPDDVAKAEEDVAAMRANISRLDEELKSANVEFGRRSANIESFSKLRKELDLIEEEIGEKRRRVDILDGLTRAFGRDGIPQLVVDSAVPHLNDIIYDLLSDCDGRWSMRVTSFKEDAKGKVQERIDILVDDGEYERDISTYSGGERNFLEYIFRVAFSILQSERSGKGLKVLALDEPMYFADEGVADNFMRMLKRLVGHFTQIFIISHSDYILSNIDNKMYFGRNSDGETVVQADFLTKKEAK